MTEKFTGLIAALSKIENFELSKQVRDRAQEKVQLFLKEHPGVTREDVWTLYYTGDKDYFERPRLP